jgi:hypothetical protein
MTQSATTTDWAEANHRYLAASLRRVQLMLERHIAHAHNEDFADAQIDGTREALTRIAASMDAPPALEVLSDTFGLSSFERDLLLLCAGIEMNSRFAALCATAQDNASRLYPTFSLALAALTEPHWSALSPERPLRSWRLIEIATGSALTTSPLRIDERVLHYLAGVQHLDERLMGLVAPLATTAELVPSHLETTARIVAAWSQAMAYPIVQLCGDEATGRRAIAASVCAALGLKLWTMASHVIPAIPAEAENIVQLWRREATLTSSALLIECDDADTVDAARLKAITQMIERARVPLMVASRERLKIPHRATMVFDVNKPTADEQRQIWERALGPRARQLDGALDGLIAQFNLGSQRIQTASDEAAGRMASAEAAVTPASANLGEVLWDVCRTQARARMDDLAQLIEPVARWEDIVLPEAQARALREVVMQVRQRARVYQAWGFARKGARGLGISALFAGASGTGKTMAAEVLANEMQLDLFRIDLSSVVSKYIGETEKNLRRVFDAAEDGGAVLLFDEADALFGKRSEVKDSHDRYANIEVSYLLQRMEAYSGLAILTTNLKSALDTAFLRRIRFIIQFPFPDTEQRAEIWQRVFPDQTPREGLDIAKLARLNIAGGNIRNIAMAAAFLAAEKNEPVRMSHLLRAARGEYSKIEKPLSESEIRGWE